MCVSRMYFRAELITASRWLLKVLLAMIVGLLPLSASADGPLTVVTFNVHSGHGAVNENLERFRGLLTGDEHILCLQEVSPEMWPRVREQFSDYPAHRIVWQRTTDSLGIFEHQQVLGSALLSKLPVVVESERLIQVDPGGDLWERRAGFFTLQTGQAPLTELLLAHYHNTYNWDKQDFHYESLGMQRFLDALVLTADVSRLAVMPETIVAGDFNLLADRVAHIAHELPFQFGSGRDHVLSNLPILATEVIATAAMNISDHNAVVVIYDYDIAGLEGLVEMAKQQSQSEGPKPAPVAAVMDHNWLYGFLLGLWLRRWRSVKLHCR